MDDCALSGSEVEIELSSWWMRSWPPRLIFDNDESAEWLRPFDECAYSPDACAGFPFR
jgi:hypothetical protein